MKRILLLAALVGCGSGDRTAEFEKRVEERTAALEKRVAELESGDTTMRAQLDKKFDSLIDVLKFAGIVDAAGKPLFSWWCGFSGCVREKRICEAVDRDMKKQGEYKPAVASYCRLTSSSAGLVSLLGCELTLNACEHIPDPRGHAPCVRVQ